MKKGMSEKTNKTIGIVITLIITLSVGGAGIVKIFQVEAAVNNAAFWGIDPATLTMLGIIQVISAILFLFKRTGILGTLLLAAYFGGAIATHLEHGQSISVPIIFQIAIWLMAVLRYPELMQSFLQKNVANLKINQQSDEQ